VSRKRGDSIGPASSIRRGRARPPGRPLADRGSYGHTGEIHEVLPRRGLGPVPILYLDRRDDGDVLGHGLPSAIFGELEEPHRTRDFV
jgi:hypothetical protein